MFSHTIPLLAVVPEEPDAGAEEVAWLAGPLEAGGAELATPLEDDAWPPLLPDDDACPPLLPDDVACELLSMGSLVAPEPPDEVESDDEGPLASSPELLSTLPLELVEDASPELLLEPPALVPGGAHATPAMSVVTTMAARG